MKYSIKPDEFEKLKRNNLIIGVLYLLVGIFIFAGSFTIEAIKTFEPSVFINRLFMDSTEGYNTYSFLSTQLEKLLEVPFMLILGSVLLASAVVQIIATMKKANQPYNSSIQKGISTLRWAQGIFTSFLIAILPILIGVNNINILITLFVLSLVFNLCAFTIEKANYKQDKKVWAPFIAMVLAFIASVGAVLPIILKTRQLYQQQLEEPYIANMNYIIVAVYFGLLFLKLIHTFLQHKNISKWSNPVFVENIHLILSFIGKVAIVGLVFYSLTNGILTIDLPSYLD
jgi:lysylphosphatidylglycerol synthetase-like protein (DUF2156 family)